MVKCFADTYALIGIINKWPEYKPFKNEILIFSDWNLMELCYYVLRNNSPEIAKEIFEKKHPEMIHFTGSTLFKAMIFRWNHRKENLSYVDCAGYIQAQEFGIPFLTGDIAFKDKEGVIYIKKNN